MSPRVQLIVECGATKSDWTLVADGIVRQHFKTGGLNFSSGDTAYLQKTLQEAFSALESAPGQIHFYAAGLFASAAADSPYKSLEGLLSTAFPSAELHLENDLLAAARALCGHGEGIAVILGTGSNACRFDGRQIVAKTASGGFILGDEGSASALGRVFIADLIKGLVPDELVRAFANRDLTYPAIVQEVYHGASPAAYLGGFAPTLLDHYATSDYVRERVDANFRAFFARSLRPLGAEEGLPVNVTGGFGCACAPILAALGEAAGIRFGRFLASPSEALIAYHTR